MSAVVMTSAMNQLKGKTLAAPEDFGKVAVIYGGWAAEKEVSQRSGAAVLKAIESYGVDVVGIDLLDLKTESKLETLANYDVIFNIVHGRGGEDGQLQALLEVHNVPYTGSGISACAIAMDKVMTKRIWQGMGIPTPEFAIIDAQHDMQDLAQHIDDMVQRLEFPMIIKPAQEGSSIGMRRAENKQELTEAIMYAAQYDSHILIERWMHGSEYTVAIIDGVALPAIQLKTTQVFYDYEAKYQRDDTEYLCPSDLSPEKEQEMQTWAVKAFNAIGCEGWGRVDVMTNERGEFKLLEVNTVPGMTDHSLVPMAAAAIDIDFQALVITVLSLVKAREQQSPGIKEEAQS